MTSRRVFITTFGLGVVAAPRRVQAQAPAKVPRVGYLGRGVPAQQAFLDSLRTRGYVIGESVLVESRLVLGSTIEEYAVVASQFVASGLDVILASNPQALDAVSKATRTIPIVGVDLESDPVAKGWVASLGRPGGNVTGFFLDIPEMSGKQLQLLKEIRSTAVRVAVLGDRAVNELQFRAAAVGPATRG